MSSMKKSLTNDILNYIIEEITTPENKQKISTYIIEPSFTYIFERLYPFIILTAVIFILFLLLSIVLIYLLIRNNHHNHLHKSFL